MILWTSRKQFLRLPKDRNLFVRSPKTIKNFISNIAAHRGEKPAIMTKGISQALFIQEEFA